MRLFSELGGFIIFSPEKLGMFCKQKEIGSDIMSFLTSNESGDIITAEGIATPIFNLEPDDYKIEVKIHTDFEMNCDASKVSIGWLFNSTGSLCICGAGYFFDYNYDQLISNGNIFEVEIEKGWYSMTFSLPEKDLLRINLKSEKKAPPLFGDFNFKFNFIR